MSQLNRDELEAAIMAAEVLKGSINHLKKGASSIQHDIELDIILKTVNDIEEYLTDMRKF